MENHHDQQCDAFDKEEQNEKGERQRGEESLARPSVTACGQGEHVYDERKHVQLHREKIEAWGAHVGGVEHEETKSGVVSLLGSAQTHHHAQALQQRASQEQHMIHQSTACRLSLLSANVAHRVPPYNFDQCHLLQSREPQSSVRVGHAD